MNENFQFQPAISTSYTGLLESCNEGYSQMATRKPPLYTDMQMSYSTLAGSKAV